MAEQLTNFKYYLSGLTIETNFELPELIESFENADGTIYITDNISDNIPLEAIKEKKYSDESLDYIFNKHIGHIAIWNNKKIELTPNFQKDDAYLRMVILGTISMLFVNSFGYISMHAACVIVNNQAILFCGDSGIGKSSIATYFYHKGYTVFSDDVTNIKISEDNIPIAYPSVPRIKLSKEALKQIGKSHIGLSTIPSFTTKYSLPINKENYKQKYKITHIVYPKFTENKLSINQIHGRDKLQLLAYNIYRKGIGKKLRLFNHRPKSIFTLAINSKMMCFVREKNKSKMNDSFKYLEDYLVEVTNINSDEI